ncbi:MAG: HXXEE domain-containing protein [Desulfobacteraceae bacterium]|nr:MAG: HXXEE domain-containing protein [Desulfobacteraceae bacterium]
MNESVLNAIKIIFLLGFTLHNLEEAIWLPKWSKYANKYHEPVESDQFVFAVIIITIMGYILTVLDFLVGDSGSFIHYVYLGFIGMMGLNSIFPHLAATIVLRKYAPGLVTALFLNLPLSLIIIIGHIQKGINIFSLLISIVLVSGLVLFSLKYLFRLGRILIDPPEQSSI